MCGKIVGRGHLKGELKVIERFNEQSRCKTLTNYDFNKWVSLKSLFGT